MAIAGPDGVDAAIKAGVDLDLPPQLKLQKNASLEDLPRRRLGGFGTLQGVPENFVLALQET